LNRKRCEHGYELGPNGEHILQSKTYDVLEHETGNKYTITETKEEPKPKPKAIVMDTDQLIAEAESLIEYNKRQKEQTKQEIERTRQQEEFERTVDQWKKYFAEKQGKIPREFPKTIFDDLDKNEKTIFLKNTRKV
jgi:hypothetical protein